MEYSAIYHDMNKYYCYAVSKNTFNIRLKVKREDIKQVILHYQDKYIPVHMKDTRKTKKMNLCIRDFSNDYFETRIKIDMVCLRYYFEIVDNDGIKTYYGNHSFYNDDITDIGMMFDCPQTTREQEIFAAPEWAYNSVAYQIFTARYASSKNIDDKIWYKKKLSYKDDFCGDLKGITENLSHIKELGADVIYLTPVFKSTSIHKYNTTDYYMIDPSFGTKEDLITLVKEAHTMNIKVILDAVFNHSGTDFFAFSDLMENKEKSRYYNWYYIDDRYPLKAEYGKMGYKCFSYFGGMPKLNLTNEEVRTYFIDVAKYWINETNIDGWRLDVGDEIGHDFWRQFRKEIKSLKKDAFIVGEIWHNAREYLMGDEWDSVMNYDFFMAAKAFLVDKSIKASGFIDQLQHLYATHYKESADLLWNLIDSHDTDRFMHICNKDINIFKIAVAMMLLFPGVPMIYYGDEYGMDGGHDPDNRRGMVWKETYQNKHIFEWFKNIIAIRKLYPCISHGEHVSTASIDLEDVVMFTNRDNNNTVTVLFNAGCNVVDVTKRDDLSVREFNNYHFDISKLINFKNLCNNDKFNGIVKPFDIAIIVE
ncbi:MAG: glycoside hydrolase family 13 protein [Lachnospiraceae bacterium]|nr:glycoside hydrolase family 13 protein [Lachnospiraceae bacterium]